MLMVYLIINEIRPFLPGLIFCRPLDVVIQYNIIKLSIYRKYQKLSWLVCLK